MPKPSTEELILKELRAIRSLLERLEARTTPTVPKQESPGPAPELLGKVKGL